MDNRVPVWLGAVVGAVAGAIGGYLYFTEPGRRLRADIEPRIGDLAREVARARDAATRAGRAAGEGWQSVRHMDDYVRTDRPGPERAH